MKDLNMEKENNLIKMVFVMLDNGRMVKKMVWAN